MRQRAAAAPAPKGPVFTVVSKQAAAKFKSLPNEVKPILRLCDGTRDLAGICAASALPAAATEKVMAKLQSLGIVKAVPPARTRKDTPTQVAQWISTGEVPTPPVTAARPEPVPVPVPAPVPVAPVAPVAQVSTPLPAIAPILPLPVAAAPEPLPAAPVAVATFSDEEEAFFARPLPEELPWDEELPA